MPTMRWPDTVDTAVPLPLAPESLLLVQRKKKLHDFTPAGQDFFLIFLSSIFKCYLLLRT